MKMHLLLNFTVYYNNLLKHKNLHALFYMNYKFIVPECDDL